MQTKDLARDGNSTVQKSLAIGLVAGAILTAHAGVSADGTVTTTSQSTTEVIPASDTPTAGISTTPTSSDTPKVEEKPEVKPSVTEVPTITEVPTTPSDTPVVPETPKTEEKPEVKPSEEVPTTPSDTPVVPDAPKTEEKPEVKPSVTEVPEKPKPAVYVPKPYENGTGSETVLHPQATGTPTVTPTDNEPVITDEGYKIVDIAKSVLTLENADGSRTQVKPELIGGITNEDGTVTIKNSKGGLETLPETGLVESMLMTLIGFLLLFFAFSLMGKGKQKSYTYL
jgi:hypothetical protein